MQYFRAKPASWVGASGNQLRILRFPVECEDRWPLTDGKLVSDWNPDVYAFIHQDGKDRDVVAVMNGWQVFSKRLRNLVESQDSTAVQFLPFRLRTIFGDAIHSEYYVANYLHLIDALSREESTVADGDWTYDVDSEAFAFLKSPVLSRNAVADAKIFRVFGAPEMVIYRADVVEAIEAAGISDFTFDAVPIT